MPSKTRKTFIAGTPVFQKQFISRKTGATVFIARPAKTLRAASIKPMTTLELLEWEFMCCKPSSDKTLTPNRPVLRLNHFDLDFTNQPNDSATTQDEDYEYDAEQHAAEIAAENAWLIHAEMGTPDTWAEEDEARFYDSYR